MPEGKVPRIPREDVPGQGQDHPVAEQVEKGLVEGRHAEPGHAGQQGPSTEDADNCFVHDYSFPGRNSSITISSEKLTLGAHAGASTDLAMASMTPLMMPPHIEPRALPKPPTITHPHTYTPPTKHQ